MEGGCYPRGGSDVMARELLHTIESHGGRVLIRAQVNEIIVDGENKNLLLYCLSFKRCVLQGGGPGVCACTVARKYAASNVFLLVDG